MVEKNNAFTIIFMKSGKQLIHTNDGVKVQFKEFVKNLAEGQLVTAFLDANVDDGTNPQLAKINKCIKELAISTGDSYENIKVEVKRKAGLLIELKNKGIIQDIPDSKRKSKKEINNKPKTIYLKSFSICSKDELGLAINAIIEIGDMVGINFR